MAVRWSRTEPRSHISREGNVPMNSGEEGRSRSPTEQAITNVAASAFAFRALGVRSPSERSTGIGSGPASSRQLASATRTKTWWLMARGRIAGTLGPQICPIHTSGQQFMNMANLP